MVFYRDAYIPGHPQCRRNAMIVGFPLSAGRTKFGSDGALSPTLGAVAGSMYDGEDHDFNSLKMLILIEVRGICLLSLFPLIVCIMYPNDSGAYLP
jgi:hypothetical protein